MGGRRGIRSKDALIVLEGKEGKNAGNDLAFVGSGSGIREFEGFIQNLGKVSAKDSLSGLLKLAHLFDTFSDRR